MVEHRRETLAESWDDAEPMLELHAREALVIPTALSPTLRGNLEALEALGMLVVQTYRVDGAMMGYCLWALAKNPLTDVATAQCVAVYVKPERRGAGAVRFLIWCEQDVKALGAKVCYLQVGKVDYSGTLIRRGYVSTGSMYAKEL